MNNVSDLNEMVVFERVVREGGFTAAARALGLSKSAVSQKVSRLEARLGARLLQRTTRSVRLTDIGAGYYERCARVVAEAREADRWVSGAQLAPRGVLRLTAPHMFGDAFLTPIVRRYLTCHPEVSVDLMLAERVVDLIDEGFDLAVRIGALADSGLVVRTLGYARSIYCASACYLRARGAPETPADLADHDCVVVGHALEARWPMAGPDGVEPCGVTGRFAANSLVMGRDAALGDLGVAFLPGFLCDDLIRRGALRLVLAEYAPPTYPICAVYPSSRQLSAKVRAFLDLLAAETASAPPWACPNVEQRLAAAHPA
jgi:DNA-binding transcriptional LysR family regulator